FTDQERGGRPGHLHPPGQVGAGERLLLPNQVEHDLTIDLPGRGTGRTGESARVDPSHRTGFGWGRAAAADAPRDRTERVATPLLRLYQKHTKLSPSPSMVLTRRLFSPPPGGPIESRANRRFIPGDAHSAATAGHHAPPPIHHPIPSCRCS